LEPDLSVAFKPKSSLTALDLAAVVYELRSLLPARVNGVRGLHSRCVAIELYVPTGGSRSLIVDAGGFMFVTDASTKRAVDSEFASACSRLRGLWLREAGQVDFDRVVTLGFSEGYALVFELAGRGNILLLSDGKVVAALDYIRVKDRVIQRGAEYRSPPPRGADLGSTLELRGNTVLQAFVHAYNCPAELAAEAMFRLGVDPSADPSTVDQATVAAIGSKCVEMLDAVRGGRLEPNIVYSDGEPVDVHPIIFEHQKLRVELKDSFMAAVAQYYEPALRRLLTEEVAASLSDRVKRLFASAEKTRRVAAESLERAEALRGLADKLSQNPSLFESALRAARRNAREDAVSLLGGLGLEVGEVNGICLELVCNGSKFRFDPRIPVYDNLGLLYNEIKTLKRKHDEAIRAASDLESQAQSMHVEVDAERQRVLRATVVHKKWFEKYRWFYTTTGKLVIAGRDAQQNQSIVRRYAKAGYTALHADIQGAPLTLLMGEADPESLMEAAQFAASYSRAWTSAAGAVDVFYADASMVSLQAPSGEYLPKGGVMFHKKEYLKAVDLGLKVGFMQLEGGETRLNAWPTMCQAGHPCASLAPGDDDKNTVAKKLLKVLQRCGQHGEYARTLRVDDLLPLVPGPSRLVESP
jgi:predicted ribosome quality control (RQC) complex YloA/Tae2 family protein